MGKHRRQLRNYLLDLRLQLQYILSVACVSALLTSILGTLLYQQEARKSNFILEATRGEDAAMQRFLRESLQHDDGSLAWILVVIGAGLVLVLCLYLIAMTHKVAGPLHKVGVYFDQIREGKLPRVHALRRRDHLQDFFQRFQTMDEALRKQAETEVEIMQQVIVEYGQVGDASGAARQALEELRRLVREKEASLA